jgi:hypothetical protein
MPLIPGAITVDQINHVTNICDYCLKPVTVKKMNVHDGVATSCKRVCSLCEIVLKQNGFTVENYEE